MIKNNSTTLYQPYMGSFIVNNVVENSIVEHVFLFTKRVYQIENEDKFGQYFKKGE